jgi:MFS family permease
MPVEPTASHPTRRYSRTRLPTRRFVAVVSTLGGIQLLAMMDSTVAIFALPKMQNELGLSDGTRSWAITAYVLTSAGLMLLGGRIGDTIGQKPTLIVGAALFIIAWGVLVLARLLKGVAAAIVAPTAMAPIATTFPKGPERNAAMAVFGTKAPTSQISCCQSSSPVSVSA